MDHNSAIENHTAERYLLGELTEMERNAYEDHFFSCSACAEEIKAADDFMETARKIAQAELKAHVYTDGFRRSVWGKWLNWKSVLQPLPAVACALLVAVSGFAVYQNGVVIPSLARTANKAQVVTTAQLLMPEPFLLKEARDSITTITVPKNKAFSLQFDVVDVGFRSYLAEIKNASEMPVASLIIPQEETSHPVHMVIPAGTLKSGSYYLVIHGVSSSAAESAIKGEPTRISFQLNIQD